MAGAEFRKAEAIRKKKKGQPKDAALCYLEALLLIKYGKHAEALPLLEEAVSAEPDYALFRIKLAENRFLLYNDPHDPKLIADVKKAVLLLPDDVWLNNFAAQLCIARKELDEARGYMAKVKALGGDETGSGGLTANNNGNLLVCEGRYEEAEAWYKKAVQSNPDNYSFLMNHASCLLELGLYGEADTVLSGACKINRCPDVLEKISYTASKKGEYKRAETACLEALKIDPFNVPVLFSLGWILAAVFRFREGSEVLARLGKVCTRPADKKRLRELRDHYEKNKRRKK